MALKAFFFIILALIISTLSTPFQHPRRQINHNRHKIPVNPSRTPSSSPTSPSPISNPFLPPTLHTSTSFGFNYYYNNIPRSQLFLPGVDYGGGGGGEWVYLHSSIGVSAMHMQLLYNNKVVIFDRTDFGQSNLSLPAGECRYNDEAIEIDCTAHSILYDVHTNTFRPLMVQTDVWCSSGSTNSNGSLIQTGGYHGGEKKIRVFNPCENDDYCDWIELPENLTVRRWYSSNQILPDGRIIIVGGRKSFSYEFFPRNIPEVYDFQFLMETTDSNEENNLYPFLHLLPDGNLFVFANNRSILFDYVNNKIVKEFPVMPGYKRSYPATGSSVLLPLRLTGRSIITQPPELSPEVEVLICGGAMGGAYLKALAQVYVAASKTCGRLKLTDPEPRWVMEEMPMNRVMSDMLLLPTGDVLIINGAASGTAGWECAENPVFHPVLYRTMDPNPTQRFNILNPSIIPRLYHSSAILLPDGRILVGGSNPHVRYNFTGVKYPTDLSLEAFSPPYLALQKSHLRPSIIAVEGSDGGGSISYGQEFSITFAVEEPFFYPWEDDQGFKVTMVAPSFTTHSFAMNQRLLLLHIVFLQQLSVVTGKVTVCAPTTQNIAPPGYYLVFLVHRGVPSHSVWIKIK